MPMERGFIKILREPPPKPAVFRYICHQVLALSYDTADPQNIFLTKSYLEISCSYYLFAFFPSFDGFRSGYRVAFRSGALASVL